MSYDRSVARWLPVSREAVAADGLHYAYADYDPPGPNDGKVAIGTTGRVHVVDARTGTDRVIYRGTPTWAIVDFDGAGIYLTRLTTAQYASQKSGLYLIDPAGGTPRPVAGGDASLDWGGWRMLNGGAAWGTAFTGGGVPAMWSGNELWRLDLKSGVATSWFKVPTTDIVDILGFDSKGDPVVFASKSGGPSGEPTGARVMLVTSQGHAKELFVDGDNAIGNYSGVVDSHGTWIGGLDGSVWLYQPSVGLQRIAVSGSNVSVEVGGACV